MADNAVPAQHPRSDALNQEYAQLAGLDEMFDERGAIRAPYREFAERFGRWKGEEFDERQSRADLALLNAGITFTVYSDEQGTERIFPFSPS
jgi:uncharacterized circularly permuted ATP-grasp superfamily protein